MQTVLSVVGSVAVLTVVVLFLVRVFHPGTRKDWRLEAITGLCFLVMVVESLLRLLVFRQSTGWVEGLLVGLLLFFAVRSFGTAKKLRKAAKKDK